MRKRFSDTSRLKADSRMIARGWVSLFKPKISEKRLQRIALQQGKKTSFGPAERGSGLHVWTGRIKIGKEYYGAGVYRLAQKDCLPALGHELMHSLKFSKNSTAAASTLDGYLTYHMVWRANPRSIQRLHLDARKMDFLLKPTFGLRRFIANTHSLGSFEENINFSIKRSNKRTTSFDYAGLGRDLGEVAVSFEQASKRPLSGLILLKEALQGNGVEVTMKKIEAGLFDKEITDWIKRNPHLAKVITDYPHKLANKIRERAKSGKPADM